MDFLHIQNDVFALKTEKSEHLFPPKIATGAHLQNVFKKNLKSQKVEKARVGTELTHLLAPRPTSSLGTWSALSGLSLAIHIYTIK
jgi:hypothetical protein